MMEVRGDNFGGRRIKGDDSWITQGRDYNDDLSFRRSQYDGRGSRRSGSRSRSHGRQSRIDRYEEQALQDGMMFSGNDSIVDPLGNPFNGPPSYDDYRRLRCGRLDQYGSSRSRRSSTSKRLISNDLAVHNQLKHNGGIGSYVGNVLRYDYTFENISSVDIQLTIESRGFVKTTVISKGNRKVYHFDEDSVLVTAAYINGGRSGRYPKYEVFLDNQIIDNIESPDVLLTDEFRGAPKNKFTDRM